MTESTATEKLYFRDAGALAFAARVVEVVSGEAGVARVRLDRTAFYPEGGGQPCDFGTISGVPVVGVEEDETGAIWHALAGAAPAPGAEVSGAVDAARRFDHMQQHTGQHLLSRVFVEQLGLDTDSFHLGAETCTIDLAAAGLTEGQLVAAEERAAEILRAARRVIVRIGDETRELALRGDGRPDPQYRVISIEGFDDCACGGTHVENTAQIEAIVIRRVERINDGRCRVEFLCGGRARRDHRGKRDRIRELCRVFSAEEVRLVDAARAALEKQKDAEKRARELLREVIPARAESLLARALDRDGRRVVVAESPAAEKNAAQLLAQELAKRERVLAALVVAAEPGEKGQLYCACGPGAGEKASDWVNAVLGPVGGKGGGSPHLAQGGFPGERLADVLAAADAWIGRSRGS